jgi:hypothetical protein
VKTVVVIGGAAALVWATGWLAMWLARDQVGLAMLIWFAEIGVLALMLSRQARSSS